jgi:NhaP-type Na+/H+ or K+/H+ antiporter
MMLVFKVPLLVALIIASCATPTDPVLSNSIVKGSFADQHVSPRLRNLISAESGANDGFGYPFLFLAAYLLKSASTGEALTIWVVKTILYQVIGAAIFGAAIGVLANAVLKWSTTHNFIDKESFLCYGIAVGIFTVGAAGYLDLDDLLAAFAAGNALTWNDWYREETEDDELQNVMDLLLNTIFFIYVGATIPWESFVSPKDGLTAGRLVILGVLVLLFRRLPALLLFHRAIPCLQKSFSEAAFMGECSLRSRASFILICCSISGFFGPIGAGSILYSNLVMNQFEDQENASNEATEQIRTLVKPIVYALVLSSILGHTLMIPVLKYFFSWRDVGNIQLLGHEGEHEDHESDAASFYGEGDADRREADYESGERREDGSTMSNAPEAQPASVHAQASWRLSSSHLPSSGHKLGTHFASEQHRASGPPDLPKDWNSRVRDLENRAGASSGQQSSDRPSAITRRPNTAQSIRPGLDDNRRQSIM